jgi:putative transposase
VPPRPIGCGRRTLHIYPRMRRLSLPLLHPRRLLSEGGWLVYVASHLRSELVAAALEMAIRRRNPSAGLIHHSDRGAQYTALSFGKRLEQAGIVPSMSRVGSALENAISESFVSTLKSEIGVSRYLSRQAARTSIFEFIELFYNRVRRHSSLGYLSPSEYEQAILEEAAVA